MWYLDADWVEEIAASPQAARLGCRENYSCTLRVVPTLSGHETAMERNIGPKWYCSARDALTRTSFFSFRVGSSQVAGIAISQESSHSRNTCDNAAEWDSGRVSGDVRPGSCITVLRLTLADLHHALLVRKQVSAIGAFLDAGSMYESPERRGIVHMLETLAYRSTAKRDSADIAE